MFRCHKRILKKEDKSTTRVIALTGQIIWFYFNQIKNRQQQQTDKKKSDHDNLGKDLFSNRRKIIQFSFHPIKYGMMKLDKKKGKKST